ncbi:MAG TPA: hypothetical protein VN894_21710 [Polyangiaceae bacterium]|nr:hypothetical protein [Polyangiaceae bacterium]
MRLFAVGLWLLVGSPSLALVACATYEDDLMRGQHAFEQSEHERALAIFRALEQDTGRLSAVRRAQYAYLRGMTDYRIGYMSEARHWLAIAFALDRQIPGSLPPDWEKRMSESLQELNEEVFTGGVASLSSSQPAKSKTADSDPADAAPSGAVP